MENVQPLQDSGKYIFDIHLNNHEVEFYIHQTGKKIQSLIFPSTRDDAGNWELLHTTKRDVNFILEITLKTPSEV